MSFNFLSIYSYLSTFHYLRAVWCIFTLSIYLFYIISGGRLISLSYICLSLYISSLIKGWCLCPLSFYLWIYQCPGVVDIVVLFLFIFLYFNVQDQVGVFVLCIFIFLFINIWGQIGMVVLYLFIFLYFNV